MENLKEIADILADIRDKGLLDIFIGQHSVSFEVGLDEKGIYLTLCPHCVGESVNIALGGDPEDEFPTGSVH